MAHIRVDKIVEAHIILAHISAAQTISAQRSSLVHDASHNALQTT